MVSGLFKAKPCVSTQVDTFSSDVRHIQGKRVWAHSVHVCLGTHELSVSMRHRCFQGTPIYILELPSTSGQSRPGACTRPRPLCCLPTVLVLTRPTAQNAALDTTYVHRLHWSAPTCLHLCTVQGCCCTKMLHLTLHTYITCAGMPQDSGHK